MLPEHGRSICLLSDFDQWVPCDEIIDQPGGPDADGHGDNIAFNKALYERVAAVYHADQSGLTREQQMDVINRTFHSKMA